MGRDDFTEITKEVLAERVGYRCSSPFCRKMTIGPQKGSKASINIGEAAHICTASPGGKRYDQNMTTDERKAYENGIWLCRTHAALIDRDDKIFTIEMLQSWKLHAETSAGKELFGQPEIKKCKFWMLIFYNDLVNCKKGIDLLRILRGGTIAGTLLPIPRDWVLHLEYISEFISDELTLNMYLVLREIEEFKEEMVKYIKWTNGTLMSDEKTIRYNERYDLFFNCMNEYFTDDFVNTLKFYTELE